MAIHDAILILFNGHMSTGLIPSSSETDFEEDVIRLSPQQNTFPIELNK